MEDYGGMQFFRTAFPPFLLVTACMKWDNNFNKRIMIFGEMAINKKTRILTCELGIP
ncbi:hypothetical protein [Lacrimispora sp.]|uniref:hypothetical protein n=1 Tax=Lacrimispora sp. TaxID=2719234 RepID=UPI00346032C7